MPRIPDGHSVFLFVSEGYLGGPGPGENRRFRKAAMQGCKGDQKGAGASKVTLAPPSGWRKVRLWACRQSRDAAAITGSGA